MLEFGGRNLFNYMLPKVYIILVNYNGFHDTIECIKSLTQINYDNYKIVVVDNGSTRQPSIEQITFIKNNATYIQSDQNNGFSAGNNIGIHEAEKNHADFVLLLNNDTTVTSDFLAKMVLALEEVNRQGIMGCKIMNYWEPSKSWFEGGTFYYLTARTSHYHEKITEETMEEVTFLTGCLMLIPMKIIECVGLLDESYFLYAEDTDYCCRVMSHGFKVFYCPSAIIYHKEGASAGTYSDIKQYYTERNGLYIAKQYSTHPIRSCLHKACIAWKSVFRGRLRFYPVWRAYVDFLRARKGKWSG